MKKRVNTSCRWLLCLAYLSVPALLVADVMANDLKPIEPRLCGVGQAAPFEERLAPITSCRREAEAFHSYLKQHIKSLPAEQCQSFEPGAALQCKPNLETQMLASLLERKDEEQSRLEAQVFSPNDKTRYQFLGTIGQYAPAEEALSLLLCLAAKDPHIMLQDQASVRLLGWNRSPGMSRGYLFCNGIDVESQNSITAGRKKARSIVDRFSNSQTESTTAADKHNRVVLEDSNNEPVIGSVIQVLSVIGDESDIPRLQKLLKAHNEYNLLETAKALFLLGDAESTIPAMTELAKWDCPLHGNAFYPMRAAWLISRFERREADTNQLWRQTRLDYDKKKQACMKFLQHPR